jgi:hypothetical protein
MTRQRLALYRASSHAKGVFAMTKRHSSTARKRYFCPQCDTALEATHTADGAAVSYTCTNPRCTWTVDARVIDDVVAKQVWTPGYTCTRCSGAIQATVLVDRTVICVCVCCRKRHRAYETRLQAHEEQQRQDRERLAADMAYVPFIRLTGTPATALGDRQRYARQVIRRNRRVRTKAERLARPARDRAGNVYCIIHQRQMRRCGWGFYCPVAGCACTYRP